MKQILNFFVKSDNNKIAKYRISDPNVICAFQVSRCMTHCCWLDHFSILFITCVDMNKFIYETSERKSAETFPSL